MKELIEIQKELKAPKNQRNNFGKYNYRSCEDILEAVKPLANSKGCSVLLSDEVVEIGGRIYVCAEATLIKTNEQMIKVKAYAREPLQQKGMNEAQITGSASSYARKYALNGLFAIDDTKDSDTNEHKKQVDNTPVDYSVQKASLKACKTLEELKGFYSKLNPAEQKALTKLKDEFKLKLS